MAVAAHIVMQVGTRHGARRTVPDFSGVKLDQAQRMARKYDLEAAHQRLAVRAGLRRGHRPRPAAARRGRGGQARPHGLHHDQLVLARRWCAVPYVAGRSLRQAKNMLEIAGLEIDELVYQRRHGDQLRAGTSTCDGRPDRGRRRSRIEAETGLGRDALCGRGRRRLRHDGRTAVWSACPAQGGQGPPVGAGAQRRQRWISTKGSTS